MPRPINFATKDDLIAFLMQGMNYIAVEGKNPEVPREFLVELATDVMGTVANSNWEVEFDEEEPWLWQQDQKKPIKN